MKSFFYICLIAPLLVGQFACDATTSQNAANFGRDRVFPSTDKENPNLKIFLNEYVNAQNRRDAEKIYSLTYPKLIELEGGRESLLKKIVSQFDEAKDFSYLAGRPVQTLVSKNQTLALIPISAKQRVAEGWRFSRGVILAVSEDGGRRWTFADATDQVKRKTLFPDAADKLEIPEIKSPWIEK